MKWVSTCISTRNLYLYVQDFMVEGYTPWLFKRVYTLIQLKSIRRRSIYNKGSMSPRILRTSRKIEQVPVCRSLPWRTRDRIRTDSMSVVWGEKDQLSTRKGTEFCLGVYPVKMRLGVEVSRVISFCCFSRYTFGLEVYLGHQEYRIKSRPPSKTSPWNSHLR